MQEYEWLPLAQALPIGGKRRVRHGAEHRENMVVQNRKDRWTAYCFACHEYAVKYKDCVKLTEDAPQNPSVIASKPPVFVPMNDPNTPVADVVKFLYSKHMSLSLLNKYNPMWETTKQRLCLHLQDVLIGRDIYGRDKAKWYNYAQACSYALIPEENPSKSGIITLAEDVFSAIKIKHYWPEVTSIALLGTVMHSDLLEYIKENTVLVVIMLDADKAGREGATKIQRKLNLHGVPNFSLFPDEGDPKDQSEDWFRGLWTKKMKDIELKEHERSTNSSGSSGEEAL